MSVLFEKVALIGLGLIASSMAHAMRRANCVGEIAGFARTPETRDEARGLGLCDQVYDSIEECVQNADLVVLCVPVGAMGAVAAQIAPHLRQGAIVSDVGSVKASVIADVTPYLPENAYFVPAHPLAGTEQSGPSAGFATLFDNRYCLITPCGDTPPESVAKVAAFWQALGAIVEEMDAEHHDRVLAVTSHAPHMIAYTMCGVADDLARVTNSEVVKFSAAGFRDFTRIAASDPTMWRDVFLSNKEATIEILGRFSEELFALQRAVRREDGEFLFDYFTRTRAVRRSIIDAGQDTGAPNFGRHQE